MDQSKAETIWGCIQDAVRGIDTSSISSFDDFVTAVVNSVVAKHGHVREDVQWCWLVQCAVLDSQQRRGASIDLMMTAEVSALLGKPIVATAHRIDLPLGFAMGWAFQPDITPEELQRVKALIEQTDTKATAVVVAEDDPKMLH